MEGMQYIVLYALLIAALIYFFMVVPNKKKHKQKQQMQKAIAPGDTVITMGGIVATVAEREEDTLVLQLMEGRDCRMRVLIYAIQQVTGSGAPSPEQQQAQPVKE